MELCLCIVSCRSVVQLWGLIPGFSLVSPAKVKARKSFLYTEGPLKLKINEKSLGSGFIIKIFTVLIYANLVNFAFV